MFRGRDQDALFHQAGRIADAGYIAADGFNFKSIEVGTPKDNAGVGGSRKNAERYWGAGMQTYSAALDRITNCLFLKQGPFPTTGYNFRTVSRCGK
jgi:hypothetical protein